MRKPLLLLVTAGSILAALSSSLRAADAADVTTDGVDDAWAEQALANPERNRGWTMSCREEPENGRVTYCEVREFAYPRSRKPFAIDGGENSGMTVMGGEREGVRILYRVMSRARTDVRARAIAADVQLELARGWLRPVGPETSAREWWAVEVKAWVPQSSDLVLTTLNGPMEVRGVRGRMDLKATNGPVSLVDLAGAVQARVENGPLHVALSGPRWDGAGLDAEAQNGPLNVALPADYSARILTGSINGPLDFDYEIEHGRRSAWISTTLGKGGPPVRVVTSNGPFRIGER